MPRPVTLFSGQWADLPFDIFCQKAKAFGYDGVEIACSGDHFEVDKALEQEGYLQGRWDILHRHGLHCYAISNHLVGQAVCDRIDQRHAAILPARIFGDGVEEGVRARAADEMKNTARAAARFGVPVVTGFTGSPIWHMVYSFPPNPPDFLEQGLALFARLWTPILDVFQEVGVKFGLEVHPTEIAFDIVSAGNALAAIQRHPAFGFNYDPSHLVYQNVDTVGFIRQFADRIFHVHIKDVWRAPYPTEAGVFGGHLPFGDHRRAWDFRSPGHGSVDFEEIIRALNDIGYAGPLSVEWEDSKMDREHGAAESCAFVRRLDFAPSAIAFDAAFVRNT
jgi:sugar phosphate isomerase/epimerase